MSIANYRIPAYRLVAADLDTDVQAGAEYALLAIRECMEAGTLTGVVLELAHLAAKLWLKEAREFKSEYAEYTDDPNIATEELARADVLGAIQNLLNLVEREQREQLEELCK